VVAAGASISADALNAGDGGNVVVWSDKATRYAGNISARGGVAGGNGGFAEVSGKQWLDFTGSVDLRAAAGETGTLLLDPYDLTIQATGTDTGVTGTNASATGSILTVSTIQSLLGTSNVVVTTGSTGEESGNITVASDISWITSNDLTLRAANNVVINANILALSGALTLEAGRTADGSSATASGSVSLNAANNIRLLSKGLTVSAVSGIALSGYVESKTLATLTTSATNSNVAASNASNIFSSGVTATSGSAGSINLKGTGNTELKAITAGTGGATIEVEKIVRVLFGGECACSRVGQLVGDCNHAVGNRDFRIKRIGIAVDSLACLPENRAVRLPFHIRLGSLQDFKWQRARIFLSRLFQDPDPDFHKPRAIRCLGKSLRPEFCLEQVKLHGQAGILLHRIMIRWTVEKLFPVQSHL
jgi:hypothetical protein